MQKLALVVLSLALTACASAGSWQLLEIDGSNEEAFRQSANQMMRALSPQRRAALGLSLHELWVKGETDAHVAQREYTSAEYIAMLHGLEYAAVVALADPTGERRWGDSYTRTGGGAPPIPSIDRVWGTTPGYGGGGFTGGRDPFEVR
jgi:hypothetical protein